MTNLSRRTLLTSAAGTVALPALAISSETDQSQDREVFLDREAWLRAFKGWDIVDVAVRDRHIVYVVLRQSIPIEQASHTWDHDIASRLVAFYLNESDPAEKWAYQGLIGFQLTRCVAVRAPLGQGIALSSNGDAFAMGSNQRAMEKVNPTGQSFVGNRGRCIGNRAYTVGLNRDVYRRIDIGCWERLDVGLPTQTRKLDVEEVVAIGFNDIDGFAEDDIYAVGGKGDVWHYDGRGWSQCRFPSRWPLFTVCCAGDDEVYISGEGGTLFAGRRDSWRRVHIWESTVPYNDARWFDGQLWLVSDYGLDRFVDGKVQRAHRVGARGHMDTADGVLAVASLEDVQIFDGRSWRDIVRPYRT
ncbi:hypothetical protein Q3C01_42235 [Bradyrhizobium sp. UFLA05-109]